MPQKIFSNSFFQLHFAVFLFGGAGLFGELINVSAGAIVLGRAFFAALFLLGIKGFFKDNYKTKNNKDSFNFIVLGVLLAFHWLAFFQAIKMANVAIGVLTFSTFPVFTIFLESIIERKKPKLNNLLLAMIAIVGVYLVLPDLDWQNSATVGFVWGVASGASFAILALLNNKMLANYSSNTVSFYQNGIAALVLIPFFVWDIQKASYQDWFYILILGIVFTGIAHTLFIHSMKKITPQTVSLVASLEPVYGILGAWILFYQIPNGQTILGGILILGVAFWASIRQD